MAMMKFTKKNEEKKSNIGVCKILIVDDEVEVHTLTKTVLSQFSFEDKRLEILSAFSGLEAIDILKKHSDIQLTLLDVVMESDDAGLIVAKKIREELNLKKIRIVLRTGQPGSAPEKEVIDAYDINDYKEKTELTSKKLYTTVISALRAYRDLEIIDKNRIALEKIIEASKTIFKLNSFYLFVEGALSQVSSLLKISGHIFETDSNNGFFATLNGDEFKLIASIGRFEGKANSKVLTNKTLEYLNRAYNGKTSFFEDDSYVAFFESDNGKILFLYIEGCLNLGQLDRNFLEVFSSNISIAFNNTCINQKMHKEEKQCVEELGEILIKRKIFEECLDENQINSICKEIGIDEKMNKFLINQFKKIDLKFLDE